MNPVDFAQYSQLIMVFKVFTSSKLGLEQLLP
jgi:hypothetical protein